MSDINLTKLRHLAAIHQAREQQRQRPSEDEGVGVILIGGRQLYISDTGRAPAGPLVTQASKGWVPEG